LSPKKRKKPVHKPQPSRVRWDYDEDIDILRAEEVPEVEERVIPIQKREVKIEESFLLPNLDQFQSILTDDLAELQKRFGGDAIQPEIGRPDFVDQENIPPVDYDFLKHHYRPQDEPEPQPSGFQAPEQPSGRYDEAISEPGVFEDYGKFLSGIKEREAQEAKEMEHHAAKTFEAIQNQVAKSKAKGKAINFGDLVKNDGKAKQAAAFLDLMILVSQDRIALTQTKPFAEIKIEVLA